MAREIKINLIGSKVELVEYPTLCSGNGISDKDTYVYVKQK